MNSFKNILILIISTVTIFIIIQGISSTYFKRDYQKFSQSSIIEKKADESTCIHQTNEVINKIGKDYEYSIYSGSELGDIIINNMDHPLVPQSFKISKGDLNENYALSKNEELIFLVMIFDSEEKFTKISKFLSYGEVFVNYSFISERSSNSIFFSLSIDHLNDLYKKFNELKC